MKPTATEQLLLDALKDAVNTVEAWHGMTAPREERKKLWEIYYRMAPEMKRIRAVLDLFTEKPNKPDPKLF